MGQCSTKPEVADSRAEPRPALKKGVSFKENGDTIRKFHDADHDEFDGPLDAIKSRAASFCSSISESGTIAGEALNMAIGAVLGDTNPKKSHSNSARRRRRRQQQEQQNSLPGATASPRQSGPGLAVSTSNPAPPPSLDGGTHTRTSACVGDCPTGTGTGEPSSMHRDLDLASPRLSPIEGQGGAGGGTGEGGSAGDGDRRRTSPDERGSLRSAFIPEGSNSRKKERVTFSEIPAEGRRAVVRNKSRLKVAAGPSSNPDESTERNACSLEAPTLPSHKSQPVPRSSPAPLLPPPVLPVLPAAKGGTCEPGLWVLRRTGNVRSKYLLADQLGRGQFGSVCIAMERATGERWACKSVSKRRVQGMHDFSMADVLREVEVLYTVGGHPGVVGLREVYEDDEDLHLIMELCQGGDWFERLINFGRYTEAEAAATVRAVLEALAYCHSLGVMHRDIKPENIMFVDRTEVSAIKLTDFGLAALFQEGGTPLTEVLGSAYYVAPEVLRESYSKEADIWSTGIVLFIALGGYAPFDGANEREVFTKILYEPLTFKDSSWAHISADAKDVISKMLTKDPKHRGTIKELLAHPWLATCAGTLTASVVPSPHGSVTLPQVAAQALAAAVKSTSANGAITLDGSFTRRLPRNSIAKAVATAIKKGKAVHTVPDAVVARLQQFTAMNAFKRQARRVLATYLPEEEVVGMMSVFKAMDKDGDGRLTMRELQQGLAARGVLITDANAKLMLQRTDLDGDGAVDYAEFLAATLHLARLERDERLYRAFRHFDPEGTGFITRSALEACLQHLPRVNVDRVLAEVDVDGDGRICYTEFCDMLRNDAEPALAMFAEGGEPASGWGAWGEATESGRLVLAMPPDSLMPSRNVSLAASRQTSCNERTSYQSLGAVSIRRSLGGNLSRNARASNGTSIGRASHTGRPSHGGTYRPSHAGSSRFGSMRTAALMALHVASDSSGRSSIRTVLSGDMASHTGSPHGLVLGARGNGSPSAANNAVAGTLHADGLHEVLEAVAEVDTPTRPQASPQQSIARRMSAGGQPLRITTETKQYDSGNSSQRSRTDAGIIGHADSSAFVFSSNNTPSTPHTPTAWAESPEDQHQRRHFAAGPSMKGGSPGGTPSPAAQQHAAAVATPRRWSNDGDRASPPEARQRGPESADDAALWQQVKQVATQYVASSPRDDSRSGPSNGTVGGGGGGNNQRIAGEQRNQRAPATAQPLAALAAASAAQANGGHGQVPQHIGANRPTTK